MMKMFNRLSWTDIALISLSLVMALLLILWMFQ